MSADIGFAFGNVVFINAGFMSRNILKHELGHTLGLPHSSRGSEEYGDRWVWEGAAGRAARTCPCSTAFLYSPVHAHACDFLLDRDCRGWPMELRQLALPVTTRVAGLALSGCSRAPVRKERQSAAGSLPQLTCTVRLIPCPSCPQHPCSSDPMGYCERCSYNAPQLVYLGWAVPIARLSAANLPVGVVRSYTLPALTATRTSTLQITVNWPLLGVNSTAQFNGTYFVSFRRPVGQDVGLPAEYVGVSVHAVAAPGRNPYLQQVLQEPQELWLSMHAGLAVARASGGGANATSATVRVCRWTTSPVAQCPGLLAGTGGL